MPRARQDLTKTNSWRRKQPENKRPLEKRAKLSKPPSSQSVAKGSLAKKLALKKKVNETTETEDNCAGTRSEGSSHFDQSRHQGRERRKELVVRGAGRGGR